MIKATTREFEVQAQTVGQNPSVTCGVAAKESGDILIVDCCHGGCTVTKKFTSSVGMQPSLSVSGSAYTMKFLSGAIVHMPYASSGYMSVAYTVPGSEKNAVTGNVLITHSLHCSYYCQQQAPLRSL